MDDNSRWSVFRDSFSRSADVRIHLPRTRALRESLSPEVGKYPFWDSAGSRTPPLKGSAFEIATTEAGIKPKLLICQV
jgi:hypothetical protein